MAAFQARSKFSQIQPSQARASQRESKKKAWISLDSLVRIEPFQWVIATPHGKNSLLAPFPPLAFAPAMISTGRQGQATTTSDFRKGNFLDKG
jgi:hypothetical protein